MSVFVGFGFGAIQGGLFVPEVYQSGNFDRIVITEVNQDLVRQVNDAGGEYSFNIAEKDRVKTLQVEGLEILNPSVPEDRKKLVHAIGEAQELCTALPSFKLYDHGEGSVVRLITDGLGLKKKSKDLPSAVIYAAENDAIAAQRLKHACQNYISNLSDEWIVFSETVIAKMCSVVTNPNRIEQENLAPLTSYSDRAILVEAYNHILIDEKTPLNFARGIESFVSKPDLNPFALTKFLGHNSMHALLGYHAKKEGIEYMHETELRSDLVELVKKSFIEEVGVGLRMEYASVNDLLFSEQGFREYTEDAVERMTNPFLRDPVERVTRDPVRKLGWNDRLIGAMKLSLKAGVCPEILAQGAAIALHFACEEKGWSSPEFGLDQIWGNEHPLDSREITRLILSNG